MSIVKVRQSVESFELGDIRELAPVPGSSRAYWLTTDRVGFALAVFDGAVTPVAEVHAFAAAENLATDPRAALARLIS